MSHRLVLRANTNSDGEIIALCNETEFWSPVSRKEAITEIETGMHTYFIIENNKRKNIVVTNDFNSKQLQVDSKEELYPIINTNLEGKA